MGMGTVDCLPVIPELRTLQTMKYQHTIPPLHMTCRRETGGSGPACLPALAALVVLLFFGGCGPDVADIPDYTPETLEDLPLNTLYVGSIEDGRIWSIDLETAEERRLVSGSDPTISPEGTLVCAHSAGLVEYVPGTPGYRVIVPHRLGQPFDEVYNDAFHLPRVSPDGRFVCYVGDFHNVFVVDRQSGELIASWVTGDNFTGYDRPTWTPENRIVMAGVEENRGVHITDTPFTTLELLDPWLTEDVADPAVSPDGESILFTIGESIYRLPTDGSGWFEEIDSFWPWKGMPTWSERGDLIAWIDVTYDFNGEPYFHSDRRGYAITVYDPQTERRREYRLSRDTLYLHPYGFTPQIAVR